MSSGTKYHNADYCVIAEVGDTIEARGARQKPNESSGTSSICISDGCFRRWKAAFVSRDLLLFFYFAFLVLCGLVLVANQYIDTKDGDFPENSVSVTVFHTEMYIIALMSFSVFLIAIFWIFNAYPGLREKCLYKSCKTGESKKDAAEADKSPEDDVKADAKCDVDNKPDADEETDVQQEEHSIAYLIFNVYVFATGSVSLMVCEIIDFFHCFPERQVVNQYKNHLIHLFFFLIMLFFTGGQIAFLTKFFKNIKKIPDSTKVKFFLVHLFATNVILSIFFVAQESGIFLGGFEKNHDIENLTCFGMDKNHSDKFHEALPDVREYLEPFVIEYILIVAGLLYSVLHHISCRKYRPKARKIGKTSRTSFHKHLQVISHTKNTAHIIPISDTTDECHMETDSGIDVLPKQNQGGYYCVLILGVLVMVIMIAVPATLKNDRHYFWTLVADYCIQIFVYLTEILVSCFILAHLYAHEYIAPELKTDDKLLLFSMTLGIMAFDLFTLIVAIAGTKEKEIIVDGIPNFSPSLPSGLLVAFCLINAISVCFISYAVIVTQRHKCGNTGEGRRTAALLRASFVYLFTTNIGHWVKDAFFEFKHDGTTTYSIGQQFYQDLAWQLINRGIYPLLVFYRFHAATMLASIWVRFGGGESFCANCMARFIGKKTPVAYQLTGEAENWPLDHGVAREARVAER